MDTVLKVILLICEIIVLAPFITLTFIVIKYRNSNFFIDKNKTTNDYSDDEILKELDNYCDKILFYKNDFFREAYDNMDSSFKTVFLCNLYIIFLSQESDEKTIQDFKKYKFIRNEMIKYLKLLLKEEYNDNISIFLKKSNLDNFKTIKKAFFYDKVVIKDRLVNYIRENISLFNKKTSILSVLKITCITLFLIFLFIILNILVFITIK